MVLHVQLSVFLTAAILHLILTTNFQRRNGVKDSRGFLWIKHARRHLSSCNLTVTQLERPSRAKRQGLRYHTCVQVDVLSKHVPTLVNYLVRQTTHLVGHCPMSYRYFPHCTLHTALCTLHTHARTHTHTHTQNSPR